MAPKNQLKYLTVQGEELMKYGESLQRLEGHAVYPLGTDSFKIDHGKNYFEFFQMLGEVRYNLALHDSEVIACAACVLVRVPDNSGKIRSAWYVCDLKVHPEFRGLRIPRKLFLQNLLRNFLSCQRGFAVSMNPASGPNPVVKFSTNLPYLSFTESAQLRFFEMSAASLQSLNRLCEPILGPLFLINTTGKKDLIQTSTGKPISILHLGWGKAAAGVAVSSLREATANNTVSEKSIYLACACTAARHYSLFEQFGQDFGQASILSFRMPNTDWSHLQSWQI